MQLNQALAVLDPAVEEHWTSDGLPRMDALVELTGDSSVTRKAVTNAAPGLTRKTAVAQGGEEGEPETPPEPTKEPAETPEAPAEEPAEEPVEAPAEEPEAPEAPVEEPEAPAEAPAPGGPGRGPTIMEGSALDLPAREVLNDRELTHQAIREIDVKVRKLLQGKKALETELAQLYAKNEILKRASIQHERNAPKKTTGVKAYLEAQQKARAERAERARVFIDAGTTAKDVVDALRPGSKLDTALNQRKPNRGTARPPARLINAGA